MIVVVAEFVALLRRRGIRVSPAETLDALAGLTAVGLADREVARATLATTLVKDGDDLPLFHELFHAYFGLIPVPEPARAGPPDLPHLHGHEGMPPHLALGEDDLRVQPAAHAHDDPEAAPLRSRDPRRGTESVHGDAEQLRLSLFAAELMLSHQQGLLEGVLRRVTQQVRLRRARGVFNPGGLVPASEGAELPIDVTAADLAALVDHLEELDVDPALVALLEAQADEIADALPDLLRALLDRRQRLQEEVVLDPAAGGVDLLKTTAAEQAAIEAAIRRLARVIRGAASRRRRRHRTGRIDPSATLRRNLRYDAVPFEPVLRARRDDKPALTVLVDLSLSTRNIARFWLQLVAGTQQSFSRVRTFAFVADVVEVTELFEIRTAAEAVETLFSSDLLDVDEPSDFGRALERFTTEHLDAVTRRTTVVVLGDGRNNGRSPNAAAFAEIARLARKVLWLTPEPRWGWSLGSCDLPTYEQHCERIEVVRTVQQLAGVAEQLIRDSRTRARV